jgi:ATP-binding cassette subfamily C protein LapB
VTASVCINLLALSLPIVVLQVYDRILPNEATDTLGFLIAAMVAVAVLDCFLRIARSMLLAWAGAKFEHARSIEILNHLLHTDLVAFESNSKGSYLDKIQGLDQIREFYHGQSILMLIDLPFVFVFLALIWLFAGVLVLIPIGVIIIFMLVSMVTGYFLRRALEHRSLSDERRQNFIIEVLQGFHTVKSMAMERQMIRRYERLLGQAADSVYVLARVNSIVQALGVSFSQAVMVTFLAIGSLFAVSGELSIGALAAGTMLAGRVLQPALKSLGLWTHLQTVRLSREKLNELLALPSEAVEDRSDEAELSGEIELKEVTFEYEGAEKPLLDHVSLHIPAGDSVAITGGNGVGKSTLLNLIMGFVHPSEGEILIDGQPLRSLDRSSMRAQIGLVPQKGLLFGGTILENMTLFREGQAVEQAMAIAKKLGLDHTITRLPEGLDTPVGSGVVDTLSEGFRQRIIMVRALVGKQKIILFDDANAGFDSRNDDRLVALLNEYKLTHTLVIISHRPSLLRLCDRTFKLADGRLTLVDDTRIEKVLEEVQAPLSMHAGRAS